MNTGQRRQRLLAVAASLVIAAVGGCSSDDRPPLERIEGTGTTVAGVSASAQLLAEQRWGQGRALWASRRPDGVTVVVTTVGVFLSDSADAVGARNPAVEIDGFVEPGELKSAALSGDGAWLVIARGSPATLRRYQFADNTSPNRVELPAGADVRGLWVAGDGAVWVDTTLGPTRWPAGADAPLAPPASQAPVGASAVLADGTTITPVGGTPDVLIDRGGVIEQRRLLLPEGMSVIDVLASPDGSVLAVTAAASQDPFVREDQIVVLDPAQFSTRSTIAIGRPLDPLTWAISSSSVAVGGEAGLSVWSLDGAVIATDDSAAGTIVTVQAAPAGFVTASRNGAVNRWSDAIVVSQVLAPGTAVQHVQLSADQAAVTIVDDDGLVMSWDLAAAAPLDLDSRFAAARATSVALSRDATQLATGSSAGRVTVLGVEPSGISQRAAYSVADGKPAVGAVAFTPDASGLVTQLAERVGDEAYDDTVSLWETDWSNVRFRTQGSRADVGGCSFFFARAEFTPDGTMLATSAHDFSVLVADAATGELLRKLPGTTTVLDLSISPNGEQLAVSREDSSVEIWDLSTFEPVASYTTPSGGYYGISFLPDGKTLATIDLSGAIALVDAATDDDLVRMEGSSLRGSAMAISPDGVLLAAPTANGIGLWSIASGDLLAEGIGHAEQVSDVVFGPDSAWIASSSDDGTVRTWLVAMVG